MTELLLRALIDTSVWISALINPAGFPARVLDALERNRFVPVISPVLMDEFMNVASRARIRRRIQSADQRITAFQELIAEAAITVIPTGELKVCRDPNDDLILETAIRGQVQYAVSRDDDWKRDLTLITHLRTSGVEVVSVAQFLRVLDERAGR